MDDDFNERLKAFKRELRELGEDVEQLRKRKANGEDVEQIATKVAAIETEMRAKFASLSSDSQEVRHGLQKLTEAIDHLRTELSSHKNTVNSLQENNKGGVWERIPKLVWLLMGVGVLALMQQGPTMWANLQGLPR